MPPPLPRSAKDVSPADDDGKLHPDFTELFEFLGDIADHRKIDAITLRAHEGLAGEFQKDSFVFKIGHSFL